MTLTFVDKYYVLPYGIVHLIFKDVNSIFLVKFLVLEIEEETWVLIILGRSILLTYRANIALQTCVIKLTILDAKMIIKVYDDLKLHKGSPT